MAEEEDEDEEIFVAPVVADEDDEIADATTENILSSPGYDGKTKYDKELDQVHLSNILYLSVVPLILLISGEIFRGRFWKTPLAAIYQDRHRGGKTVRGVYL